VICAAIGVLLRQNIINTHFFHSTTLCNSNNSVSMAEALRVVVRVRPQPGAEPW
jgi:hypothetical protein